MTEEVSRELTELDVGDWPAEMADAGEYLSKCDYNADPAQLQILIPSSLSYGHNFWQIKVERHFPKLVFAANKLRSAHHHSCSRAELVRLGAHLQLALCGPQP